MNGASTCTSPGALAVDPDAWLRDRNGPRVLAHIDCENAYADHDLAQLGELRAKLYEEILDRVDLNGGTMPVPHGPYTYYSRNEQDKPYPVHCRRGSAAGAVEEIVLDENELAAGKAYFVLSLLNVSPDHSRCLFGIDTAGDERLSLFVRELTGERHIVGPIAGAAAGGAWANDSETFFSVRRDDRNRPFQLVRHHLAPGACEPQGTASDELVWQERDEAFRLRLNRTESGRYLILTSWAHDTTELHFVDADHPAAPVRLLYSRRDGVEAYATHQGEDFYILTDEDAPTKKIIKVPVADPAPSRCQLFMEANTEVDISHMRVFANHLIVSERCGGLPRLRIVDSRTGQDHLIELPDPVCALQEEDNREFETAIFRFGYASLTTPYTVYDYHMDERRLELRKQTIVRSYDPSSYRSERLLVPAADGARVPLSLVYRKGLAKDGNVPVLLYGYGAYGYCLETEFSSLRLSLLDRGFVYAIAHVRGGGELGKEWHEQGRGRLKHNSFGDFIACAEYLVREGYTSPRRLAIMGESAGGLLVAAVLNARPDLFAAAVVDGPFVDVVNSLSDETLPLTVSEWKEWGSPHLEADCAYLRSYSPCENVRLQDYPSILILCSFTDPRVPYWEGLKWAARIREMSTNEPDVLVKIRLDGGHQGVSDRFEEVREWALIYAFIIDRLATKVPRLSSPS
ncbi:S9 family peptidase [Bradyrhizobium brasilense]|uniref:S9 family peptidase n=1 Tax=Bradyrhizobium brasilense TaxID=1419277 RepID=UPI002878051A|nr:S9 family peptidase [Bradyrhizobium brasilense]MCP3417938.1 S9 family peptidase [Bradyrhizobium brasilense]